MLGRDVAEPLKSVYLITGSDRPKIARAPPAACALRPGGRRAALGGDASGADAVAACNALGLFGGPAGGRLVIVEGVERWRKADVEAVESYLGEPVEGRCSRSSRTGVRGSPLAELVEKAGTSSLRRPEAEQPPALGAGEFKRLGIRPTRDAGRALVEIVGEDTMALSSEIEKLAAWAGGEPSARADVEGLAAPAREQRHGRSPTPGARAICRLSSKRPSSPSRTTTSRSSSPSASHRTSVACARPRPSRRKGSARASRRPAEDQGLPRPKGAPARRRYSRDELDAALVRLAELDAALKGAPGCPRARARARAHRRHRPAEQPVAAG